MIKGQRDCMRSIIIVPTYHLPEEVNARAAEAEEMKASRS